MGITSSDQSEKESTVDNGGEGEGGEGERTTTEGPIISIARKI